jgi:hypothetical protein
MALIGQAVNGSMAAAEMLMDMWVKSKREGDFVLEEEFDRYPADPTAKKKTGPSGFDFTSLWKAVTTGK